MPRMDGTGPFGMGPMTGRGMGFGRGCGFGRRGYCPFYQPAGQLPAREQQVILEDELKELKRAMTEVEKELSSLKEK